MSHDARGSPGRPFLQPIPSTLRVLLARTPPSPQRPGWTSVGTSVWQPCPLLEPPSGRLQARPGQAQAGSSLRVAQNHGFPMPTHAKTKNPYGRQPEFNDYPLDSIGSWWVPTRSCWGWGGNVPPRKSKSVDRQSEPDIPSRRCQVVWVRPELSIYASKSTRGRV